MNNASLEDIPDIVKNADPVVAMAAQRMANTRTAYLANEEKVEQEKALNKTAISTDVYIDPALPEESQAALKAEVAALEEEVAKNFINGTFVDGSRGRLEARRQQLAGKAFAAANAVHTATQNEHNKRQGEYRRLIRDAESHSGTKTEREAIKTELKSGNRLLVNDDERKWSEQAITDEWRRQQREAASRAYPEFAPPTATTDDADLPTYTPEQAAELPKGTRFRGEDGNIYTA
jgi:DNA repair photolyase